MAASAAPVILCVLGSVLGVAEVQLCTQGGHTAVCIQACRRVSVRPENEHEFREAWGRLAGECDVGSRSLEGRLPNKVFKAHHARGPEPKIGLSLVVQG